MNEKEVKRLERLSCFRLTSKERAKIIGELDELCKVAKSLDNDIKQDEFVDFVRLSDLRDDMVESSSKREELLELAQEHKAGYFVIPKIME